MRQIELTGSNQKQLESVVHNKIRELNAALKKANKQYNDWDNVDERTKRVYKTPEDFKARVIDWLREDRAYYIKKLHSIRQGYIAE